MRRPVATAAAVLAAVTVNTAQPPGRASPQDRFRSGVELVEVDVIVTDSNGHPVRGLTQADFTIREDGTPVGIVSFDAIDLPAPDTIELPSPPAIGSGASIGDNLRALEGSIYLILLDFSTHPARFDRVRKTALALIEQLGPTDQVAMMSMHGQRDYQVEFTTDRARLRGALQRLVVAGPSAEKLPETVERVSKQLELIPSRRKVMALISEGFYFDPERPDYRLAFDAARRANVAIYTFDPRFVDNLDGMIDVESVAAGIEARTSYSQSVEGLQMLAANTGGRAAVRTNQLASAARRMAIENRMYYLLRYYSPAERDGKFHRIEVRTTRPGLEVRARPGYVAAKGVLPMEAGKAPSVLQRAIGLPIQTHGLDMRIIAVPRPSSARTGAELLIVSEIRGADLAGGGGVELNAVAVAMSGKVQARGEYAAALTERPTGDDRWVRIVSRLEVPPGRYQVRVAARGTTDGPTGSVFTEVEVPRFSGDLALGGLVLGTRRRAGTAHADALGRTFPVVPIATMDLPADVEIVAALPVRVAARHRTRSLGVVAGLVRADGRREPLLEDERPAAEFTGAAGGTLALSIPWQQLGQGSHRLFVVVRLPGGGEHQRELTVRRGGAGR